MMFKPNRFVFLLLAPFLMRCASSGEPTEGDVLQPVEPNATATVQPIQSPTFIRLKEILQKQGYEGVGLTYETEDSLTLLLRVFSDSRSQNRQIRLVYTGLQMAYDKLHESLTIGGNVDPEAIVSFIVKTIPVRPKAPGP